MGGRGDAPIQTDIVVDDLPPVPVWFYAERGKTFCLSWKSLVAGAGARDDQRIGSRPVKATKRWIGVASSGTATSAPNVSPSRKAGAIS